MKKFHLSLIASALLLLASCSTPKDVTYFPELNTGEIVNSESFSMVKVRPEDKLTIVVTTPDPGLTALFNLVTTQNNLGSISQAGMIGTPAASGDNRVSFYTVDPEGNIDFPVLGKIHIDGLTRFQVASKIKGELISRNLVKDPIVTVEYANAHVAVLGEVRSPGLYGFNNDRLTILDAIASAGDLTINGVRERILVLRNLGDGRQEAYRVNLLNAQELAQSPVYYLQQDDVIYVEPNNKLKRETTPNGNSPYTPAFWISLGSTALTVATLIITLTK